MIGVIPGLDARVAFLRLPGVYLGLASLTVDSHGHLAPRHPDAPHVRHSGHWRQHAARYLQLAKSHIDEAGTT